MDLTISLVNMDNLEYVRPCLESVRRFTEGIEYEVIVVDNCSPPATVEALKREFPWVTVIENDEVLGFASNHNLAIARSRGRHVVILNDDTYLVSNLFGEMVHFLDEHADVGAVGPKFVFPDGTYQMGPRGRADLFSLGCWELKLDRLFPRSRKLGRLFMSYWDPDQSCEMETGMGACLMVRREVIDQVGPLEERIFFGSEDLEWSHRMREAGWKLYYRGDLTLIHHQGVTMRKDFPHILTRLYKGVYWFLDRNYGWGHANAYRIFAIGGALVRIPYWGLVYLFHPSQRARSAQEVEGRWAVVRLSASPRLRQIIASGT